MSDSPDPNPELEIKSDADWKQRVKQESADLDAKRKGDEPDPATSAVEEESAAAPPPPIDASQLPRADFTTLVTMFSTQAMVALGVIPSPIDGKPDQNLPLAKHFIDLLGVLQEKTRRNLTGHEANLLEQSLHELRIAYVELSKADSSPAAAESPT